MQAQAFFQTPDSITNSEMGSLLRQHYLYPVTVYLDTLNQTFFEEIIPPTNFLNRKQVIRQLKLEHKNESNSILNYKKAGDIQQFSTVQLTNNNALWFNFINQLENPLDSVRSMAIELQHLVNLLTESKPVLILIYYHKGIGFRQSVFISRQFYLSRFIPEKSKNIQTEIAHQTKNLTDYIKREETGLTDKDIHIIGIGESEWFRSIDPRHYSHLEAINLLQIFGLKTDIKEPSFLPFLVHVLSRKRPKASFNFDISSEKEKEELYYILINALTFGISGFALFYLLGTFSSFNILIDNAPKLRKEIKELEQKNSYITNDYDEQYSESYQVKIEDIEKEFNKQTDEIRDPLKPINLLNHYLPGHWEIQKIEWSAHSPRYVEHSLLEKVARHRSHAYFSMDIYLKFKGPRHRANDMFTALLQTPELKRFHIESKGMVNGFYILGVTERESI